MGKIVETFHSNRKIKDDVRIKIKYLKTEQKNKKKFVFCSKICYLCIAE